MQKAGTSSDPGYRRGSLSSATARSLEKRYLEKMKELQFDTAELVRETDDGRN